MGNEQTARSLPEPIKKKQKVLGYIQRQSARLNKVWYYCSADDIARKLKIPRRSVSRYLSELEKDGAIISKVKNKKGYDKTKSYKILNWTPWMPCALDDRQEKALQKYMDKTCPPPGFKPQF